MFSLIIALDKEPANTPAKAMQTKTPYSHLHIKKEPSNESVTVIMANSALNKR